MTDRLKHKELERKEKEAEFKKRQRFLDEFLTKLKDIEDSTLSLQEHLDVKLTIESELYAKSETLPLPLNTLFRKLYNF